MPCELISSPLAVWLFNQTWKECRKTKKLYCSSYVYCEKYLWTSTAASLCSSLRTQVVLRASLLNASLQAACHSKRTSQQLQPNAISTSNSESEGFTYENERKEGSWIWRNLFKVAEGGCRQNSLATFNESLETGEIPSDFKVGNIIIGSAENYRKRGSASYIVREVLSVRERERERYRERERERERERDGSDVTIVARLAMNSHFHLPKIRTIGDELTLSLAKNSHISFLPSHFPSFPSRRGHHCGAEIRNEFTLSIAKIFFALFVPPSFKRHEPHDEWSKIQDKWSNPAQSYFVLPIEKLNQINTKNYWK